jgi:glycosyltransferase involved in cell wall biosynthesis
VVYCSDLLSAVPGLLARLLFRPVTVYHEHDPPTAAPGRFHRLLMAARRRLTREATVCVIPNAERAAAFERTLRPRRVACVWNCPERREVLPARAAPAGPLVAWFHGSLTPSQLPLTVVEAVGRLPGVRLRFAGYETVGHPGYVARLLAKAAEVGAGDRVEYVGTPPGRPELFALAATADVGLLPFERPFRDPMAGASNKPFDYLACGLALLYTDAPEWHRLYGEAGCGRGFDPADVGSVEAALGWFAGHRQEARAMGERGRQRVLADWNYETQFAPVRALLEGRG